MAVPVRKVRDHQEAAELVRALESSGQDLAGFCGRIGIDPRSLHCWRLNLRRGRRTPQPPSVRLVEVSGWAPQAPAWSSVELPAGGAPSSTYRVHVGPVVVEVDDRFQPDTLARLLQVVRAC